LPDLKLFSINDIAKERDCFSGYDEERKSNIVDEDKLLDAIEDDLEKGGLIIDWHVCDIFPERLVDLVVVLRSDNTSLYDRLAKRQYSQSKIEENIDAEIMQVILDEARDAYVPEIVVELQSNTVEDMDSNIERIVQWKEQFEKDHKS
jgi:adenylate kinase